MRVRKRDGTIEQWNDRKIIKAMLGAFQEVVPDDIPDVKFLSIGIKNYFDNKSVNDIIFIEEIQDQVEKALMDSYPRTAKAYVIYRHERAKIRAAKRKPDPDAIANYIHPAKYGRHDFRLKRREIYEETVFRVEQMHMEKYPELWEEIRFAFDMVRKKLVLPSMRSMQFAGARVKAHHASMYNCAFTLVDRPEVFGEIFYLLLCGCGVGFSVQWSHVEKIPKLARINKKHVVHYHVADTIIGWANAITMLINSYTITRYDQSHFYVEFDYSKIRPEGSPLKTSGGLAPGHLPLKKVIQTVRGILDNAQGRQLRPIECHDIICHIAEGVLAGGIRRSSLMSLFSPEDTEMMYCKAAGNFDPMKGVNFQRCLANNAAVLIRKRNDQATFNRVIRISQENFGDPSFFFTDDEDYGTNPCGEIGLHPVFEGRTGFAFCNLTEVNGALIEGAIGLQQAVKAATIIGTLQSDYISFPYLGEVTESIAKRDRLLGVSITGIMDNPSICLDPECLRLAAKVAVATNRNLAVKMGINPAQRITTVKPSGTASLELGCVGSGIHPHHAKRYFRRITANPNEPVAKFFAKHNPHMVEKKPNGDICLVFPVEAPKGATVIKDMTAAEFLDAIFTVYANWVAPGTVGKLSPGLTHNVSCTVVVKDDELEKILPAIWENRYRIAAMSFVSHLLDKKYPFAPREEISTKADEDKWNNIIANYVKVDWTKMREDTDTTDLKATQACEGPKCEV